jgi:hypothetical protein
VHPAASNIGFANRSKLVSALPAPPKGLINTLKCFPFFVSKNKKKKLLQKKSYFYNKFNLPLYTAAFIASIHDLVASSSITSKENVSNFNSSFPCGISAFIMIWASFDLSR